MSIEGGMKGEQRRLVCPNCGKVFFAWRPDEHPAVKIKCYFCRHEFADEAARRQFPLPPEEPAHRLPAEALAEVGSLGEGGSQGLPAVASAKAGEGTVPADSGDPKPPV